VKVDATDPFDLQRFVSAQSPVFAAVLRELDAGRKRTHWMWFVFPQLRGLGHSAMARRYGIGSLREARAYYAHPLLGPRLALCTERVLAVEGSSLHEIFGVPDDRKFASSMTLFSRAAGAGESRFRLALERFCGGYGDDRTLAMLAADENARPDCD
jgi:uncharacterized protein (DUF1810 family)